MIDRRLFSLLQEGKKYIYLNVLAQWISLAAGIVMMYAIALTLDALYSGISGGLLGVFALMAATGAMFVRYMCAKASSRCSFLSSRTVKKVLREKIYRKLVSLGRKQGEEIHTAELVQTAVEGVDQLETYYGAYLPQFFYAMLAPLTLFAVLCFVSWKAALVLLICVPLIPVSIIVVQRWAKKLLGGYWDQYTGLGDSFLENLQGLTTLKIYQADEDRNRKMNEEAEKFRAATMRVLIMQLNSISVMDLTAYGGAAVGIIVALLELKSHAITLYTCLMIILLSAEFFLPMRQLGSYFHIAMNGMAAADKIFAFLAREEGEEGTETEPENHAFAFTDLSFAYDQDRTILKGLSGEVAEHSLCAIVGESGCGKSTLAKILCGKLKHYNGSAVYGGHELRAYQSDSLYENITYVSDHAYLYKGTVRDNLLMGNHNADDEMLWEVLRKVRLDAFLQAQDGLDTELNEAAGNLSGGQKQRLALGRALLHDTPVFIFDEATSNIDAESEAVIMDNIRALKNQKTIILISHRLMNVRDADQIFVMEQGMLKECGRHEELLKQDGLYARMWKGQMALENYGKDGENA